MTIHPFVLFKVNPTQDIAYTSALMHKEIAA